MPISIIIVGIGKADFTKMDILDADDSPMKASWGEYAKRDIVQFVPFSEFKGKSNAELAKAVLEEVPGQLLSYFKSRDILPNPPKPDAAPAPAINPYTGQPQGMQQQQQPNVFQASYSAGPGGSYGDYLNVASQFAPPPAYAAATAGGVSHFVPGQAPPDRPGASSASPYTAAPASAYFVPPPHYGN